MTCGLSRVGLIVVVAVVVFFIYVRASVTRRNQLTNGEAQKRRLLIGLHLEGEYAEDDDAAVVQYVRDAVQSGGVLVVLVLTSDLKLEIQPVPRRTGGTDGDAASPHCR